MVTLPEFCTEHACTPWEVRKLRLFLLAMRLEQFIALYWM